MKLSKDDIRFQQACGDQQARLETLPKLLRVRKLSLIAALVMTVVVLLDLFLSPSSTEVPRDYGSYLLFQILLFLGLAVHMDSRIKSLLTVAEADEI